MKKTIAMKNHTVKDIKRKLKKGYATIGSWMQLPDTSVAEIMGNSGYDWIAVDLEHGGFSRLILPDIFRSLLIGGTVPFARVAQTQPNDIKQALDAGAQGLILPMIESGKQLEDAISNALYPPKGNRGVGYCRANLFGKDFDRYFENSKEILLVAQIEHFQAVSNLDEILSVDGLDAIMVGPYDLSGSMDLTGQFESPQFLKIMEIIVDKASEYKVPMGVHIVQPDRNILESKVLEGYQFIAYGIDSVFLYNSSEKPKF